jgi:hypothetical protein
LREEVKVEKAPLKETKEVESDKIKPLKLLMMQLREA